jgi:hypothetical protein
MRYGRKIDRMYSRHGLVESEQYLNGIGCAKSYILWSPPIPGNSTILAITFNLAKV